MNFSTMCTIALLIEVVAGAPLVLAANRDELYARPSRSPEHLAIDRAIDRAIDPVISSHRVVGGVDAISGGSWLAVRSDAQFAAVTNQRVLSTPPLGLRSRGLAVRELAASSDQDSYVAAIDPAQYPSMNLVWGTPRGVRIAYVRHEDRRIEIEQLGPGIHVLCNDRLGAPGFPRGARLHAAIEADLAAGVAWPALAGRLAMLLGDHTRVSLAETPDSHLPAELARELTATCIHGSHYGTRSATILAADFGSPAFDAAPPLRPGHVLAYLHADGPPCTTPFIDHRALLETP